MIGSTKNAENRKIRKEYGYKASCGIGFKQTIVTPKLLMNELLYGKVFCHLFNPQKVKKDGSFGSSQKTNANFIGSYVVGVDIDYTRYPSVEQYVAALSLQPTFYYTSYSNLQSFPDGTIGSPKFRLIYVFDSKIENLYYFRYLSLNVNNQIEYDVAEQITDNCNLRASQYFNGTYIGNNVLNISYGLTDYIYSFTDFGCTSDDYIKFLTEYAHYKTVTEERTYEIQRLLYKSSGIRYRYNHLTRKFESSLSLPSKDENKQSSKEQVLFSVNASKPATVSQDIQQLLEYYDNMSPTDFKKCALWEELRQKTKYLYRKENAYWELDLYQCVDDDYFALFYPTAKIKDGQKRRKSLYERMCLRRVLNFNITKDEMIVNTIIDILRFYDNSDGVLNSGFIRNNIESAFRLSIDDIYLQYQQSIEYLKIHTRPKKGIIYIDTASRTRETTFLILDNIYNFNLSIKENIDLLDEDYRFKTSRSTIYEFLKDRDRITYYKEKNNNLILEYLDMSLSLNRNRQMLKERGVKCSERQLRKLYSDKKKKLEKA